MKNRQGTLSVFLSASMRSGNSTKANIPWRTPVCPWSLLRTSLRVVLLLSSASWISKSCKSWRGHPVGRNKNVGGRVMRCPSGRKCSNEIKHISPAWVCLVCMSSIGLWCNRNADPTLPSFPCFPIMSVSVCLYTCACPLCKLILYHPHSKSWADKLARRWQRKRITSLLCSRLSNKWSFVPCVCVCTSRSSENSLGHVSVNTPSYWKTTLFLNLDECLPTNVKLCLYCSFKCCYIRGIYPLQPEQKVDTGAF